MQSLIEFKTKIEDMDKMRQIEILKILKSHNAPISVNKNGSFINLTVLPQDCIDHMKKYVEYTNDQDKTLNELEDVKAEFVEKHFTSEY